MSASVPRKRRSSRLRGEEEELSDNRRRRTRASQSAVTKKTKIYKHKARRPCRVKWKKVWTVQGHLNVFKWVPVDEETAATMTVESDPATRQAGCDKDKVTRNEGKVAKYK